MATKLNLTSKLILDEVFQPTPRGYDPLQVDTFLDKIIQDYLTIEANELIDKQEIEAMRNEITHLKEENYKLVVENGVYKNRLGSIKDSVGVTSDNLELIRKISKYEKFLFAHGFDISDID